METVLIDTFVVPEAALEEFVRHAHFWANRVKTRPGFLAGYVFRRAADAGQVNVGSAHSELAALSETPDRRRD